MLFNNLKIGHISHPRQGTGLTVFLPDKPAACGYWLCGGAPATRDVHVLDAINIIENINALLFTGGSAYGLDSAHGVMRWLQEKQQGFATEFGVVPIVPAASIYDFSVNGMAFPNSEDAYEACMTACVDNRLQGAIGAGTGASVGKLSANGHPMSAGFGFAEIASVSGINVSAFAVVNALGDVINSAGEIIAGATDDNGQFINLGRRLALNKTVTSPLSQHNTTLACVFTNAAFNKTQLTRIARMASAGLARAISPAFTSLDGDIIFAVSLGGMSADDIIVGNLSALALQQAIVNAVSTAQVLK